MIQTNLNDAVFAIKKDLAKIYADKNLIIAIEGPCASGKTTLANILKDEFKCNIISVDDFFLQPHQRTQERLNTTGGNFDRERFLKEVIRPLKNNTDFSYRPYDCKKGELSAPVNIEIKTITLIEGVYSCHPELLCYYDYRIFVKADKETQLKRLEKRNPQLLNRFISEWIPMEEKYFSTFDIESKCDFIVET